VVEAMAAGCPVITTARGSLAEVAGDAALTVESRRSQRRLARRSSASERNRFFAITWQNVDESARRPSPEERKRPP